MDNMKRILVISLIMLILIAGCTKPLANVAAMKPESVVETLLQAASKGDVDTCLCLLADDIVIQQYPTERK
jgi:hypothetical protein